MHMRLHTGVRTLRRALLLLIPLSIPTLPGPASADTLVRVFTALGPFDMQLFDDEAPATVRNFLAYVERDDWNGSFFHRSVPGFVVQAGGFSVDDGALVGIPADPPVANEFGRSNLRGTVAMAKLAGDPDSATNQWFVNLADNSGPPSSLDTQNGGFTVFGEVVAGMEVVDTIAALDIVALDPPLDTLPLRDWDAADPIFASTNLVFIDRIEILSPTCISKQHAAAAKLCKAELSCMAKYASKPEKDPTLASLSACRDKAHLKFTGGYEKAFASASSKDRFCGRDSTDAAGDMAETGISAPAEELARDVLDVLDLAAWDSTDRTDNAQRAGILKAAARFCGKELSLLAKDARKPDPDKLAAGRAAARAKFDASADKAIAKAAARGVGYPGLPVAAAGDRLVELAEAFVAPVPNSPPVLEPVGNRAATSGAPLAFTAIASDPDLPAQALTFSLVEAPAGASIDPVSGLFSWTPAAPGSFEFAIVVTDDGTGPLSSSETIQVVVGDPP